MVAQTKSTAPWSVKGIERDAREKAKDAARREGMTLGEWLNRVIYIAGDGETGLSALETDAANDGIKLKDLASVVGRLSDHVAAAEKTQINQVEELSRKVGGVLERVQRLEQSAGRREQIDQALIRLAEADRARAQSIKALETAVTHVATQFNRAQKQTGERFATADQRFNEAIAKLAAAGGEAGDGGAAMGAALNQIAERLDRVEKVAARSGPSGDGATTAFMESAEKRFQVLGDEIKRAGDRAGALEKSIMSLTTKIEDAEKRSAVAVERVAEAIAVLREDILSTRQSGDAARSEELERNIAALAKTTEERIGALQGSFEAMLDRLEKTVFDGAGKGEANDSADASAALTAAAQLASADAAVRDESAAQTSEPSTSGDALDENHTPAEARDLADDGFAADDDHADYIPDEGDDNEFADPFADDIFEETHADDDVHASASQSTMLAPRPSADVALTEEDDRAVAEQSGVMVDDDKSDIDDIMAELDALGFGEDEDDGEQAAIAAGPPQDPLDGLADEGDPIAPPPVTQQAPPPALDDSDEVDAADDEDDTSLAPTPENNEASATGGQKRRLTPRQRAILQAKIRRKRLAEARARRGVGDDADTGADLAAAFEAPTTGDDDRDEDETAETDASKPTSLLDRLHDAITRGARKRKDASEGDVDNDGASQRTSAARPVTIALGAGVVLTGATLAFLMRDGALSPEQNASLTIPTQAPQDTAAAAQSVDAGATELAGGAASASDISFAREEQLDPSMQPRDLFVQGIEAFSLAEGERGRDDAVDLIKQAAALGHPPAQLHLGELYKVGQSVERDAEQARAWYRRAANGGHVLAMHRLGVMSARGEGGPADAQQSIDWFEKAANYGLVNSMYNLGATFHPTGEDEGTDVQDRGKSYYWYSVAAKNGDDQAASLAEGVSAGLSAEEKAAIDARVSAWTAEPRDPEANERFDA